MIYNCGSNGKGKTFKKERDTEKKAYPLCTDENLEVQCPIEEVVSCIGESKCA